METLTATDITEALSYTNGLIGLTDTGVLPIVHTVTVTLDGYSGGMIVTYESMSDLAPKGVAFAQATTRFTVAHGTCYLTPANQR